MLRNLGKEKKRKKNNKMKTYFFFMSSLTIFINLTNFLLIKLIFIFFNYKKN